MKPSTTLATTKLQMSISPKTSPLSTTTTSSCLTRCSTSTNRKEVESPRNRKLHSTSPLLSRTSNPHTLKLGVGIGHTANRSVHRSPMNSKFFELLRTIATNILSNDISFCCHWHLLVLFIQLRIGSNTGLMVLQPYMVQRECNRLQRFFPLRRLQFTLPYCDAVPAHFSQFTLFLLVTLLVSSNLSYPELTIRLRNLAAPRTLDVIFRLTSYIIHHVVSMPEASIYKDARPILPQYQVWMSWQPLVVQPIPEPTFPQSTPHNHLRLRVLRVD